MVLGITEKILYCLSPGATLEAGKGVLMGQANVVWGLSLLDVDVDLDLGLPTHLPRHLVRGVASEAALYLRPEGRFCGGLLSDDFTLPGPDASLGACRPLSPVLQQF